MLARCLFLAQMRSPGMSAQWLLFDAMVDAEATLFALEDKAHDRLFGERHCSRANPQG